MSQFSRQYMNCGEELDHQFNETKRKRPYTAYKEWFMEFAKL